MQMTPRRDVLPRQCKRLRVDADVTTDVFQPLLAADALRLAMVPKGGVQLLSLKKLAGFLGKYETDTTPPKSTQVPVIGGLDVRILASMLIEFPEDFMVITRSSILALLRGFLVTRNLAYERVVYRTFFRWLEVVEGLQDGLTRESDIALMRIVALRLGKSGPQRHTFRDSYAPVLRHLGLLFSPPAMSEREVEMVRTQAPAPYTICLVPDDTWRNVVRSDVDLFRLDHVLRGSWGMQPHITGVDVDATPSGPDEPLLCVVCLEMKPRRMFAMLTCERHVLCAACVLQCRAVAAAESAAVTVTFRCPLRCQFRCSAMPMVAYEYQQREMQARLDFNAFVFNESEGEGEGAPAIRPVVLRAGDYIRLRLAGRVKTWVRVDEMLGTTLAIICADAFPIAVLARSDVVLDTMRGDSGSVPLNTDLSAEELEDIAENAQQSITYALKGEGAGHKDVRHYHMCTRIDGAEEAGVWTRVKKPVAREEFSVQHSRLEPVYGSLQALHAVLEETHAILPTMLPSACRCVQLRGFQLAKQSCLRCRRVVCTPCFGSVSSVCAFCKACDAIGPHVLETHAASLYDAEVRAILHASRRLPEVSR